MADNDTQILKVLENLQAGQANIEKRLDGLAQGQKSLEQGQKSLEQRQKSLEQRQKSLEQGQKLLEQGLRDVRNEQDKEFKAVRKDLKSLHKDVELVLKYHDEMYLRQQERIKRIAKHVGLPTSE